MSPLQWSLLILGAAIVAGLVFSAWREKKLKERPRPRPDDPQRPRFGRDFDPEASGRGSGFDEFGVGRARKAGDEPAAVPPLPPAEATAPGAAPPRRPSKLVGLYIAEHEGTAILGPKIHKALESRGLEFGAKKIYHRMKGGQAVFSVASLTKPGTLDPAEAQGFSTPGLSVFLQLPGPVPAEQAFDDMLATAKALASDLKAEVFDTEQQSLLTPQRERELLRLVRDFADGTARA